MSVIDTKLNNLNIWEGTTAQVESAYEQELIGENDLVFITDETPAGSFEDKFRYSTMPFASADWAGKIVQYIGGTDGTYVEGGFYKCTIIDDNFVGEVIVGENINTVVVNQDTFNSYWNLDYNESINFICSNTTALWYEESNPSITFPPYSKGWSITVSGDVHEGDKVEITRNAVYGWQLVKLPVEDVEFENITGNPHDNTALGEELDSIATQVTTLPEITEDTKDRIYQYIGEDDFDNNLFKGSFYKAYGSTYQLDTENSQYIDDMSFIVNNESQFLQIISDTYIDNPSLPDQSYFNIVFYGQNTGDNGYPVAWWIDKNVRPTMCNAWNERYSDFYGGIKFGGQPIITDINDPDPDTTPNTYFHILISKPNANYQYWNWYPISIYPYQHITSSQVLVNKSRYDTSIIDKKSGDNMNSDGPNNTIIGVNSNGHPSGFSTIFGFDNWGNYLSTVVGAHNRNIASASIVIGANTRGTSGEYGICIGVDSGAGERAVAIGPSAQSYFRSVAIGQNANASNNYDIALGSDSAASGSWSIAIGNNAKTTSTFALALGYNAQAKAQSAVQIGEGINLAQGSLQFRNYVLLENNGTIPVPRLSANSPEDGYVLTYDEENGVATWASVLPDIPITQESDMPPATAGRTVQYIGESDGTYVEGYFYKATYNSQDDVYYWRQIDTQPSGGTISYDSLDDKPSISGVTIEGDLDLVDDFGLARVASTGSYADLTTKPGINGHPLLTNTSAAELEISYNDLVDLPAPPASSLPDLPEDKDEYDYMLKWDHVQGKLVWFRATDTEEDLGEL